MKKITVIIAVIALVLSSCSTGTRLSVTKKYHSAGWNIEFENNRKSDINNDYVAKKATKNEYNSQKNEITSNDVISEVKLNENEISSNNFVVNTPIVSNSLKEKVRIFNQKNNVSINSEYSNPTIKVNKFKNRVLNKLNGDDKDNDKIIAILILFLTSLSFLAVYFHEGRVWTKRCTTNLILWFLCILPGFIHGLIVIFGDK